MHSRIYLFLLPHSLYLISTPIELLPHATFLRKLLSVASFYTGALVDSGLGCGLAQCALHVLDASTLPTRVAERKHGGARHCGGNAQPRG